MTQIIETVIENKLTVDDLEPLADELEAYQKIYAVICFLSTLLQTLSYYNIHLIGFSFVKILKGLNFGGNKKDSLNHLPAKMGISHFRVIEGIPR